MFYIFNASGKNIASCDFEPDREDLVSRGEFAIEYHDSFHGELQFTNGEIKVIEAVQSIESKQAQVWEAIKQKPMPTPAGAYISNPWANGFITMTALARSISPCKSCQTCLII
ncbi:Uncharacterised protein [Moraxella veridica]|uniref:hypothetical protein n=1 Tax=Moraxella veridica TaxID=3344666 RepID=UPI000E085257|nr:hypothetical protein [Moraxella catarrhalis]STY82490.1 Uncharacterised protein [Moraxella catarrhalis]